MKDDCVCDVQPREQTISHMHATSHEVVNCTLPFTSLQDLYIIVIDLNLVTLRVPLVLLRRVAKLSVFRGIALALANNGWWRRRWFGWRIASRDRGHHVRQLVQSIA